MRGVISLALAVVAGVLVVAAAADATRLHGESMAHRNLARSVSGEQGRDWEALRRVNPDIVAWVSVEGASVDYPVLSVTRGEYDYYLSHDLQGRPSASGCLILDERCDENGAHLVVYGHHLAGTNLMLSELGSAWDPATFEGLGTCEWETPEAGPTVLKPCCAAKIESDDALYLSPAANANALQAWHERSHTQASARRPREGGAGRIVTFVTCSSAWAGAGERCAVSFVATSGG